MNHFYLLNQALDYAEAHLSDDVTPGELAAVCHCSLSTLQKLFRYTFHISVAEYVARRRLTCCARELIGTNKSALDIALDYGYHSPEVFTRAFSRLWGETPAAFRKKHSFFGIFPKFELLDQETEGGENMSLIHRKYDVTELYDYLSQRRGTYVIAFDIMNLMPINDISTKAGDMAIRESLQRIEEAAGEDMLLFRIGGDEFVLATGLADLEEARRVERSVTSRNGEPIQWEGHAIPLGLHSALYQMPDRTLRYSELFPAIGQAIDQAPSRQRHD